MAQLPMPRGPLGWTLEFLLAGIAWIWHGCSLLVGVIRRKGGRS